MSQIGEEGFNPCDGEENPAQDIEVLCSDEIVNCFAWIVCSENCRVVCDDVDYSGYEEGCKPETTDGGEEEGNPFSSELLDEELRLAGKVELEGGYKHDENSD
jgi:hypothetical protein